MGTQRGPRSSDDRDLNRVGVKVVDHSHFRLKCMKCGQQWSPMIEPGGRLPRKYWQCPNGCNVK